MQQPETVYLTDVAGKHTRGTTGRVVAISGTTSGAGFIGARGSVAVHSFHHFDDGGDSPRWLIHEPQRRRTHSVHSQSRDPVVPN